MISFIKKHWKIILIIIIIVLFFPLLLGSLYFTAKTIPLTEKYQNKMYMEAANSASKENAHVDWKKLVAIDAVRFKQNFDKASSSKAEELAEMFIKEEIIEEEYEEEITDEDGNIKTVTKKCRKKVYSLYSLEDVLNKLGFSDNQKRDVNIYLVYGLSTGNYSEGSGGYVTEDCQDFINRLKTPAQETYKECGVFPSIVLAQAILESGWGKSQLSSQYNNLFGIKANGNWNGEKILMPTSEYNGQKIVDWFRVYPSWDESLRDHGRFLVENERYRRYGLFSCSSYVEQAQALEFAGYSTVEDEFGNNVYAKMLIDIIQQFQLNQYD